MNEIKQILTSIGNLPAGEKLYLRDQWKHDIVRFKPDDGTEDYSPACVTADDLHQLREYVERVETALIQIRPIAEGMAQTQFHDPAMAILDHIYTVFQEQQSNDR